MNENPKLIVRWLLVRLSLLFGPPLSVHSASAGLVVVQPVVACACCGPFCRARGRGCHSCHESINQSPTNRTTAALDLSPPKSDSMCGSGVAAWFHQDAKHARFQVPPPSPIPLPASSSGLRPGAGGGGDSVRSLPLVVCTRSSVCTRPVRGHPRRFIPRWCLETATVLANRQSLCGVDRSMDLNHPGRRMCRRTEKIIPPRQPPATQQRHAPRRGPGRGLPAGSGGGGAMDARTASKLIATG